MLTHSSSSSPSGKTRNRLAGGLLGLLGLYAVITGRSYGTGSLTEMGPGFFPVSIGVLLMITAALIAVSASEGEEEIGHTSKAPFGWRGPLCIVAGLVAFEVIGRYGGFLPATFAIVFIAALGDRQNRLRTALALAVVMCALSTAIFWWGLKVQLPLLSWG